MLTEENSGGSVYSTHDWLNNHFSIKSEGRFNYVSQLPIRSGDRVLDLGCANGSWSKLVAERVGISGKVLAVDQASELISEGRTSVQNTHLAKRLSFEVLDISKDLTQIDVNFDVVTAFNVGCLLAEPLPAFREVRSILEARNGILILKDSAISTDFYWPMESTLAGEIRGLLDGGGKINGYDPNFAFSARSILQEAGFYIRETRLHSYPFTHPFLPEHKQYISQNAQMIAQIESNNVKSDNFTNWVSSRMSETGAFFEDPQSIYTTTEFTHICSLR